MDPQQAQAQAAHMMAVMLPMILIFSLIFYAVLIIPLWKIATKAGLSGPLSLLALIPGIGLLIVLYVIAFMDWKVMPAPGGLAYPPTYPPQPPAYPPSNYPPQS